MEKEVGTPDPERAKNFAALAHAAQLYNDEVPYTRHLEMVIRVLERFGYTDPAIICAAWLHDSIEDTNASYGDINKRFGRHVAELVYAVTSELGRNRSERNRKTYPKLADAEPLVRALKLADRIANVEYGHATGGKNDMYSKEFPMFEAALRYTSEPSPIHKGFDHSIRDAELEPMWNYLSKLLEK